MYIANENRFDSMQYRRCGNSGLLLPAAALGLWQNFGIQNDFLTMEKMVHTAFDLGITHFDAANNYGYPNPGTAEENFKRIMDRGFSRYRHDLIISTKAGYDMWKGPYGVKGGSRRFLMRCLDDSLQRLGLDYVDIFYHHAPDDNTPIEETAVALDDIVRSGKAIYVGISNYNKEQTQAILKIFRELRTPFVANQIMYSLLNLGIEYNGLYQLAQQENIGLVVYSPLHQGVLTGKYNQGVPENTRAYANEWLKRELNETNLEKLKKLEEIARERGQSLTELALAWVLRDPVVSCFIIGARTPEQIVENVKAIQNIQFTDQERQSIRDII